MPRPQRCRWIGGYPNCWRFSPEDSQYAETPVTMSLDEYETVRLLDREELTQEQCAERMGVSRTTVTAIYGSARKKLARMLVDGKPLQLSGGNYRLIQANESEITEKGNRIMRIAVTYENGEVFQHFGRTARFKLYDVENGTIVRSAVMDTNGSGHGALAGLLHQWNADVLICGGIGPGAQMALSEAGIRLYAGASGSADGAVQALLAGTLPELGEANCDHHDHSGGGCGHHTCGSHGCGE